MSCFPCFSSLRSKNSGSSEMLVAQATGPDAPSTSPPVNGNIMDEANAIDNKNITAQTFTFRELAAATKNFRQECLLGEGGFGRVYKGTLQPGGKVVAVKQLDRNGMQGNKEFQVEVLMLSLLNHPNLVTLIGYCADGDQRLLVYEYMPLGSIEDHLLDISGDKKPLEWIARMKIASGTAQGLEYLHEKANPPVIYRDLKSSNILLDEELNPRLSDYGLAKLGLGGSKMHVSPRVMGTYGYCAPEYERKGELTLKSDVYSFGVILLELITGRRAVDTTRPTDEQNLVSWAQPFFKDPKRFPEMADPLLESKFPVKSLNQAVGVAAMCLQEEPSVRPLISDVVAALSFLTIAQNEVVVPSSHSVPNQPSEAKIASEHENHQNRGGEGDTSEEEHDSDSSSDHDGESSYHGDGDSGSGDHEEEENSEKRQVKKSVKWSSRCKSRDGSAGSSSFHNSNIEPCVESSTQNLNSNGSAKWGSDSRQTSKVESQDGGFGSNSSHDSNVEAQDGSCHQNSMSKNSVVKWGSNSSRSSKVKNGDGSGGSSSSSDTSDDESLYGSSFKNSRSNSNIVSQDGSCHQNSMSNSSVVKWGSNSKRSSKVKSREGSGGSSSLSDNSDDESLDDGKSGKSSRSKSNVGPKYRDFGSNSRQESDVGSDRGSIAFELRSNSYADSQDGSVGSNLRQCNSNAESQNGSSLRSDSSGYSNSRRYSNVGSERGSASPSEIDRN